MLRPCALQPPKKPRPPEPAPPRRLKLLALWPLGMLRPGGSPRQHAKVMGDLKEQVIQEESRCQTDFLSTCQAALHTSPMELKCMLVASYQILLGQASTSHPFTLSQRTSPVEEQSAPAAPPVPVPKQSPRPKRWYPSPDPVDSTPLGGTTFKTTPEEPPSSKW